MSKDSETTNQNDGTKDRDTTSQPGNTPEWLKGAASGLALAATLVIPGAAVLAANAHDIPTLLSGMSDGPTKLLALLAVGSIGSLAFRHYWTARKQNNALEKQARALGQLRTDHQRDTAEIKSLLTALTDLDNVTKHLVRENELKATRIDTLEHTVKTLSEQLMTGGHEIDEYQDLYKVVPGTIIIVFNGKMHRECDEVMLPGGLTFRASKWGVTNWLPRITKGTAVTHFEVVFVVPNVDPALAPAAEQEVLFLIKKFVGIVDDLVRIAKQRGLEITLKNIRVSIARNVPAKHCERSIIAYTRQTDHGAEPTVVTYQRSYTNRTPDPDKGKVLVYPGEDQQIWRDRAQFYYHTGLQLTFEETKAIALSDGPLPKARDTSVITPDHVYLN